MKVSRSEYQRAIKGLSPPEIDEGQGSSAIATHRLNGRIVAQAIYTKPKVGPLVITYLLQEEADLLSLHGFQERGG